MLVCDSARCICLCSLHEQPLAGSCFDEDALAKCLSVCAAALLTDLIAAQARTVTVLYRTVAVVLPVYGLLVSE